MVSLSQPPLHTAPLFISKRLVPIDTAPANPQEAASAAAAKAKQHEQQQQQQQNFSRQGADSPASAKRNLSFNGEEALIQENPKYEVGHRAGHCVLHVPFGPLFIDCFVCAWWPSRKWSLETRNWPPGSIIVDELNLTESAMGSARARASKRRRDKRAGRCTRRIDRLTLD